MAQSSRNRVFISYSHRDKKYLDRLHVHLAPYERERLIEYWDDTKLETGTDWRQAIKAAIDSAQVAILLVSADFLASRFIAANELPPLLAAAEDAGVKIFSVVLAPCSFDRTGLARYQAIHDVSKPLSALRYHQKEEIWRRVADMIAHSCESPSTTNHSYTSGFPKTVSLQGNHNEPEAAQAVNLSLGSLSTEQRLINCSPEQLTREARQLNKRKEFAEALQTIQHVVFDGHKDYQAMFEYIFASASLFSRRYIIDDWDSVYNAFILLYHFTYWRSMPFGQNEPVFPADASFALIAGFGPGTYSFEMLVHPQVCYFLTEDGPSIVKGKSLSASSVFVDGIGKETRWVGLIASWA